MADITFLLDANVLIDFQLGGRLEDLVRAADTVGMAVAEAVYAEVALERPELSEKMLGKRRQARKLLEASNVRQLEILPGSAQHTIAKALKSLRDPKKPLADKGEADSVAVAAADPSLVLVTGDTTATLWGLNELSGLGERVMRPCVFVRRLYALGAIGRGTAKAVAPFVINHAAVPVWWPQWVAETTAAPT